MSSRRKLSKNGRRSLKNSLSPRRQQKSVPTRKSSSYTRRKERESVRGGAYTISRSQNKMHGLLIVVAIFIACFCCVFSSCFCCVFPSFCIPYRSEYLYSCGGIIKAEQNPVSFQVMMRCMLVGPLVKIVSLLEFGRCNY